MKRIERGDPIRAAWLTELADRNERQGRLRTEAPYFVRSGPGRDVLGAADDGGFWAQLMSRAGTAYGWREMMFAGGGWIPVVSGRAGTPSFLPAYEINGATDLQTGPTSGVVVYIKPGCNEPIDYRFIFHRFGTAPPPPPQCNPGEPPTTNLTLTIRYRGVEPGHIICDTIYNYTYTTTLAYRSNAQSAYYKGYPLSGNVWSTTSCPTFDSTCNQADSRILVTANATAEVLRAWVFELFCWGTGSSASLMLVGYGYMAPNDGASTPCSTAPGSDFPCCSTYPNQIPSNKLTPEDESGCITGLYDPALQAYCTPGGGIGSSYCPLPYLIYQPHASTLSPVHLVWTGSGGFLVPSVGSGFPWILDATVTS